MDDALLVRGFERVGDLPRDRQRLVDRDRAARDALRPESSPSTSSITSARDGRSLLRGRRSRRCSDGSARRGLRLRAGSARAAPRRRPPTAGSTLIATSRFSLRVGRAIDLAHAALADLGGDLVRAEAGAGSECHGSGPHYFSRYAVSFEHTTMLPNASNATPTRLGPASTSSGGPLGGSR